VSAVDTATERQILQALRTARPDKTTILISHRVSSIRELDKLLFLEDGRLTAVGTHAELYEHCLSYRRMVDLQKLDEEGGDLNG
jgi:ATP-binding cassette subfamily B protein